VLRRGEAATFTETQLEWRREGDSTATVAPALPDQRTAMLAQRTPPVQILFRRMALPVTVSQKLAPGVSYLTS
jgi:hypothetical protein